jgi:hypothetical protein
MPTTFFARRGKKCARSALCAELIKSNCACMKSTGCYGASFAIKIINSSIAGLQELLKEKARPLLCGANFLL